MKGMPVETSSNHGSPTFPAEWGYPQGSPGSDERATWVRESVRKHMAVNAYRTLAARDQALLNDLRLLQLKHRQRSA